MNETDLRALAGASLSPQPIQINEPALDLIWLRAWCRLKWGEEHVTAAAEAWGIDRAHMSRILRGKVDITLRTYLTALRRTGEPIGTWLRREP